MDETRAQLRLAPQRFHFGTSKHLQFHPPATMSSRIPGAFDSDDSEADLEGMTADDEEDDDFAPASADELTIDDGDESSQDPIEMDEDDAEEAEEEEEEAGGEGLQIAYDAATRQILIIDRNGNAQRLEQRHLTGTSLTLAALRAMVQARVAGAAAGGRNRRRPDDDDDDDQEEEEDDEDGPYWGAQRRKTKAWYEPVLEPVEAGVRLERSGDFGPPPKRYASSQKKLKDYSGNLATILATRTNTYGRSPKSTFADAAIPNSAGTEVSQFTSKVYSGQYSADGSFFYAACQDFRVYIYDTRSPPLTGTKSVTDTSTERTRAGRFGMNWQHRSSLKTIKVVKAHDRNCRWTITDANVSRDNEWLIYSSITPRVHLVKTGRGGEWETEDHEQSTLDFSEGVPGFRGDNFGIWSIRFSNDGREIIAGANTSGSGKGQIFVYDLETNRTVLRVRAHEGDVNAVAFADTASGNLLLSGSDDAMVKVWDRRSLSGERASGTLVGHTEGITFVAPKGDGRYCLSNGKDQAVKLWDLRMMMSDQKYDQLKLGRIDFGIPGWDYRCARLLRRLDSGSRSPPPARFVFLAGSLSIESRVRLLHLRFRVLDAYSSNRLQSTWYTHTTFQ
ncbi:DDB1- and CUL4-associated factor 11, partial [Phenoliferia sp. Uapishka_3]